MLAQGKKVLVRSSGPAGKLVLKLPAATRRALAKTKRVSFTLTVTVPQAAPVKQIVTLRR